MIDFLMKWGEAILTMSVITTFIVFPYGKFFKPMNYNSQEAFKEGYDAAVSCIKKGKDRQVLYDQCQGDDNWDRGWLEACENYEYNILK